jgi:hypothetical protein
MQTLGGKLKRKQKAFQRICDLLIDFKEFAFVSNNSAEKSVATFDLKVRLHAQLKLAYFAFHVMLEGLNNSLHVNHSPLSLNSTLLLLKCHAMIKSHVNMMWQRNLKEKSKIDFS